MTRLFPFIISLTIGNLLLLMPPENQGRCFGALIIMALPGLIWAEGLTLSPSRLQRGVIGLGLSYSWLIIGGMLVHYLPGPITPWRVWGMVNLASLGGLMVCYFRRDSLPFLFTRPATLHILLMVMVFYAAIFRLTYLGYSEFQDDEVDVMTSAAEIIVGHEEMLFVQRRKGPAEVLLPTLLWQLTGTTSEFRSRLPFALASLAALLTAYCLVTPLFTSRAALVTTALLALNGFMVAFARIVQYQSLVVWFSLLALLCAWQWRQTHQKRFGLLLSLFLATSFLAHYDTLLIFPAIAYLLADKSFLQRHWKTLLAVTLLFITLVSLFFIPYTLSAQANRTSQYLLNERIGEGLFKNKLDSFMELTIFYNSSYYLALIGLALAWRFSAWITKHTQSYRFWVGLFALILLTSTLTYWSQLLLIGGINLAFVPFAAIFFMAWQSPQTPLAERVIIIWLGTTFLAYNFVVADPRTHIYVMFTPWIILASLEIAKRILPPYNGKNLVYPLTLTLLMALFSGYLYLVYLRQDIEFMTDWPRGQVALYPSPYQAWPETDTGFGMVHKIGWKAIGGLYATQQLQGDYQTNGIYEISDWYTYYQLRGCYYESRQFFALHHQILDPADFTQYGVWGDLTLANDKGLTVYQRGAPTATQVLDVTPLEAAFDRQAYPAAFVQPKKYTEKIGLKLVNIFTLQQYTVRYHEPLQPTDPLAVMLYWQTNTVTPLNLMAFVELTDAQGKVWAQDMRAPNCGNRPTSTWKVDEVIPDLHVLTLAPDLPVGEYTLKTGLYFPQDNVRLPVLDEQGQPIMNEITIYTLKINPQPAP